MSRIAITVCVCLVVIVLGCSSDPARIPSSPDVTGAQVTLDATSTWIGSEGGQITLGGTHVIIPPGALSETIQVTLETGVTNGLSWCVVGPSSVVPNEEITVTLPEPVEASRDPGIRVYDDGTWLHLEVTRDAGSVVGRAAQFSRFEVEEANG